MKRCKAFLQCAAILMVVFSCSHEEVGYPDEQEVKLRTTGVVLDEKEFNDSFAGNHTVAVCLAGRQDEFEQLRFSIKNKKNKLQLIRFQDQSYRLNFETDVSGNQIQLIGPSFSITGRLENDVPVFDVFFDEYNYCSNPPTIQALLTFDGAYTLAPCTGFDEPISFTVNTFEGGELALIRLNGDQVPFEFFTNKEGGIVSLEYEGYSFTGKLVDGVPQFLVAFKDITRYCSTSLDVANLLPFKGNFDLSPCLIGGEVINIVTVLQSSGDLLLLELNGERVFETFAADNGEVSIAVNGVAIEGKLVDGLVTYRAIADNVQYCQSDRNVPVLFKANIGTNLSSENGLAAMVSTGNADPALEVFELRFQDDGSVALKANNGLFVTVDGTTQLMRATSATIGTNEKFMLAVLPDGKFTLQGFNQKYVSSENGQRAIRCNRNRAKRWERFDVLLPF